MSVLNFAADWDLRLGTDELSLRPIVDGFTISQPKAASSEPLIWSGTIDFTEAIAPYFAVNLSPRTNAARWRRGQRVKLTINGQLFLTLRLLRYFFDDEARSGQLEVACELGYRRGAKPVERDAGYTLRGSHNALDNGTYQRIVSWVDEVRRELARAGINNADLSAGTAVLSTQFNISGSGRTDGFSAEPAERDADPIAQAQAIAGSRGYWLTCTKTGGITLVRYPVAPQPQLQFARAEVDDFALQQDGGDAPDVVKVVGRSLSGVPLTLPGEGGGTSLTECCGAVFPIVTVTRGGEGGGIIEIRTTERPTVFANRVTRRSSVRSRMDVVFDNPAAGSGLITSLERDETTEYDSEGYPLVATIIEREPLGVIDSAIYGFNTARIVSREITEVWNYTPQKQLRSHSVLVRRPGFAVFGNADAGQGRVFDSQESEEWAPLACDKYQHIVRKFKAKGAVRPDSENPFDATPYLVPGEQQPPEEVDAVPSPPFREVDKPEFPQEFAAQTEAVADDAAEDGQLRERTLSIPHVTSAEQAQKLAELEMRLYQQRRFARTISRPTDSWTVANYAPFQVEDVHDGRFVRDGFAVLLSDGELAFAYTGNEVGVITPIARPVRRVTVPSGGLAISWQILS